MHGPVAGKGRIARTWANALALVRGEVHQLRCASSGKPDDKRSTYYRQSGFCTTIAFGTLVPRLLRQMRFGNKPRPPTRPPLVPASPASRKRPSEVGGFLRTARTSRPGHPIAWGQARIVHRQRRDPINTTGPLLTPTEHIGRRVRTETPARPDQTLPNAGDLHLWR